MTHSYLVWYPTAVSLPTLHQRTWKGGGSSALSTTVPPGNVLRGVRGRPSSLERGLRGQSGEEGGGEGEANHKAARQTAEHCL